MQEYGLHEFANNIRWFCEIFVRYLPAYHSYVSGERRRGFTLIGDLLVMTNSVFSEPSNEQASDDCGALYGLP
jgi:hypothetical protein